MQKRYWEERKEYWDEAGEEERQMCKGERNGEKWRLREERIRREGTKSEIQLQNHVFSSSVVLPGRSFAYVLWFPV